MGQLAMHAGDESTDGSYNESDPEISAEDDTDEDMPDLNDLAGQTLRTGRPSAPYDAPEYISLAVGVAARSGLDCVRRVDTDNILTEKRIRKPPVRPEPE